GAAHEGVRRGLGPRAARNGADRVPRGLSGGVSAPAQRRLGARRLPTYSAGGRSCRQAARRGVLRAPPKDARQLARPLSSLEPRARRSRARGDRRGPGRPGRRARAAGVRRARFGALMISAPAPAKINLALVVGPTRPDGLHEVATLLQRIDLADMVSLEPAD